MTAYAFLHTAFTDAFEVSTVSLLFAKCREDMEFLIYVQHRDLVCVLTLGESVTCLAHVALGTLHNLVSQCVNIHFDIFIDLLYDVLSAC